MPCGVPCHRFHERDAAPPPRFCFPAADGPGAIWLNFDEIGMDWPNRDDSSKGPDVPTRTKWRTMKRGLFRTIDSYLGECARVHEDAGDAYPFLRPDLYKVLGFDPPYEDLPMLAPPSPEREPA